MRVDNAAINQLELDIYGALIDSIYLYDKWGQPISSDLFGTSRRWQQGNVPQAFTHLALISAAFNLDRALG